MTDLRQRTGKHSEIVECRMKLKKSNKKLATTFAGKIYAASHKNFQVFFMSHVLPPTTLSTSALIIMQSRLRDYYEWLRLALLEMCLLSSLFVQRIYVRISRSMGNLIATNVKLNIH